MRVNIHSISRGREQFLTTFLMITLRDTWGVLKIIFMGKHMIKMTQTKQESDKEPKL